MHKDLMWKPKKRENHKILFLYQTKITFIWFMRTSSKEATTPYIYQHQMEGSINSLIYRLQPEGSSNSPPYTTMPPWYVWEYQPMTVTVTATITVIVTIFNKPWK